MFFFFYKVYLSRKAAIDFNMEIQRPFEKYYGQVIFRRWLYFYVYRIKFRRNTAKIEIYILSSAVLIKKRLIKKFFKLTRIHFVGVTISWYSKSDIDLKIIKFFFVLFFNSKILCSSHSENLVVLNDFK